MGVKNVSLERGLFFTQISENISKPKNWKLGFYHYFRSNDWPYQFPWRYHLQHSWK
jgi:hypothetical protein